MQESFQTILNIQEFDIKMIRLLKVKKEHQRELKKVLSLKEDIHQKVESKEKELIELKNEIQFGENQMKEFEDKITKLEAKQALVKKMDEFNALTQEMASLSKEKRILEHKLSDLMDKVSGEEDLLISLKENLSSTEENSTAVEKEISSSIKKINEEGRELLAQRTVLTEKVDPTFFKIYERLLKNKKDRVVVPIENRVCSGCHIVLTPQHENLVRKKDRLVFCEHCSRILFWQDIAENQEEGIVKRRRRRLSI